LRRRRGAGGVPLESRWDEAERGQAAGVRDAGTEAEPDAGRYLLKTGIAASSLPWAGSLTELVEKQTLRQLCHLFEGPFRVQMRLKDVGHLECPSGHERE